MVVYRQLSHREAGDESRIGLRVTDGEELERLDVIPHGEAGYTL